MKQSILFLIVLAPILAAAQIITPTTKGKFGVDGDLRANVFNGLTVGSGDDWFFLTPGSGFNVIDTTGAAAIIAGYNSDVSPWPKRMATLFRPMSVRTYTFVNQMLWLDALWVRDYHGTDTTVFTSGSDKNAMSPADWTGGIQGIPDKNDILDVMMHIRRAGPNTTDSLWMFGGISMDQVSGNRYFDFEMYQTDINYDRASGNWYGYGPDLGHTSWQFDAAGNVTKAGDIIFSGEFQSTNVLTNIEARVWVSRANWTTVTPTGFTWSGLFDGASAGSSYGYASITPNAAGPFYIGLGCANNAWTGPFGLVLQNNTLAFSGGPTATTTNGIYNTAQFIEFAVNLTKLGLDPVTTVSGDVCGTPFNKLVVKTRASASFTSELKDFVAPTDLFLAPRVFAAADIPIFCGTIGVSTLQVQNPSSSSIYTWATADGHIVGPNTGPTITVDAPGTYIVTQQLAAGCNPYAYDTLTVAYDPTCVPLDNNILSFKGAINNGIAKIDWTVAQNKDVSYFDVERSFDGRNFGVINHRDADLDKTQFASYSAYDDLSHVTVAPAVYYRLKLKNTNGGTSYSKIIRIPFGLLIKTMSIAPNPVRDMMQVTITTTRNDLMDLSIYDLSGKVVRRIKTDLQPGVNVISVDNFSTMQRGMYVVVASIGEQKLREKIVLSK